MKTEIFTSKSEQETRNLGRQFAENLHPGLCILLYGDLGAGKTVFVRGICEAFGISGVRSPSFTLINQYESDSGIFIIHADLYRLDDNGAESLGLEEYYDSDDSILIVEWPERWNNPPEKNLIKVFIDSINENERVINYEYISC